MSWISSRGVPSSHIKCSFDSFVWKGYEQLKPEFANFLDPDYKKGLILIGDPGVGKTHLMVSTYRKLQEVGNYPGSEVNFFRWEELLFHIKEGFNYTSGEKLMRDSVQKKFTLIDDIKPELNVKKTFWHEQMQAVITNCYEFGTKLMLSTNAANQTEFIQRLQISDYYQSRLVEMCDIIVIAGKDKRIHPIKTKK